MAKLKERILRAHSGQSDWKDVAEVMACCSMGGLEFVSRLHFNPLRDIDVHLNLGRACLTLGSYPKPGFSAHFSPSRVWIEDPRGECVAERAIPGGLFRSLRNWISWDQLDVVHYAGIWLWQALQQPFLLNAPGVKTQELTPVEVGGERWHRLQVRYPEGSPSLTSEQVLCADPTGLIRRIEYSAGHYGPWLKVSQRCEGHESFGGFVFSTSRIVHPCLVTGHPWRLTTLAWLSLDDITVLRGSERARV